MENTRSEAKGEDSSPSGDGSALSFIGAPASKLASSLKGEKVETKPENWRAAWQKGDS